ncbi:Transcriptional regulator, LysR family [Cupriavidus necator]|uniref:Transcriptional regulator, LysR family n=1 Tax=Cupriavidus necator TaxID=106590 RepID=A0A1K0JG03_CUPNE|nr:Transcriptional regulator, LysR family [Cupriavidus necator]
MNDLTRIHAFISAVRSGSLSAAARAQDTSVTTIARQVSSLEEELKVRLLHRSSRKLTLTEPGKLFYARACALCTDLRNAMQEASSFQAHVKGTLRISLRPSVGHMVIVPALPGFLARYPDLKIDVSFSDVRQDLIADEIDVAVWMGAIPDSDIVARRLSPGERIAFAAPAYLQAHGVPRVPEDLTRHQCLLFKGSHYGSTWRFTKAGMPPAEVAVSGVIQTDNTLALYAAALAGGGVMVANEWGARAFIAQGRLQRVLADYQVHYGAPNGELHAVYASNRGVSRKVRVFVDFLVELFKGEAGAPVARPVSLGPGPRTVSQGGG